MFDIELPPLSIIYQTTWFQICKRLVCVLICDSHWSKTRCFCESMILQHPETRTDVGELPFRRPQQKVFWLRRRAEVMIGQKVMIGREVMIGQYCLANHYQGGTQSSRKFTKNTFVILSAVRTRIRMTSHTDRVL